MFRKLKRPRDESEDDLAQPSYRAHATQSATFGFNIPFTTLDFKKMRPDFLADLLPTTIPMEKVSSSNAQYRAPTPTSPGPMDADKRPENVTWAGLKSIVDVLHKATDAFGPLKSAFDELSKCADIFEHEAKAREDYRELRNELDQLFRSLLLSFDGSVPLSMTPVISSLAQGIKKEADLVLQKERRRRANRYAEAAEDADEILKCYRRIQALLERLTLNSNLSMWKIIDEQATDARLRRLPHTPAAKYRSAESDSLRRNGCTPNTRVAVLQQLREWAHESRSPKIYWLNGMVGTGKTTIAYSLCEYLESTGKLAASFFCSRQLPSCRDVNRILPSIAYQLSLFSRPFRYAISSVLEQDPEVHNQPLAQQFEDLVTVPLQKVERTFPMDLVVVIDALDECEDNDGVDRMLHTLLSQVSNLPVKFFIASRPNPKILDHMRSELSERVRMELRLHELDHSVVQEDIRTYLTAELKSLKLSIPDLDGLTERSGALFIYAATAIRYIGRDNFSRGRKRLRQVLETSASSGSDSSQEVDTLYTGILQATLDDKSLQSSERDEIYSILCAVVGAQEPLTVNALARLLRLDDPDSVLAALRPLLSVLQVSDTSGLVTTLHESFPDYMFDQTRSGKYWCDAEKCHAYLAQLCFVSIKQPNPPFNICNLQSSYLLDREVPDLNDRVKTAISGELFYACRYWGTHLGLATRSMMDLLDELYDLLSMRLLLWMEVLNLKQCIYDGVKMLHGLQNIVEHEEYPDEIRLLVRDAWRFVAAFSSSPISESTPHIYVSALPFWPKNRPVSTHYVTRLRGLITVTGRAMGRREFAPLAISTVGTPVFCVTYSPNGAHIVSGSEDGTIRIWDAHTGQAVGQPLRGHTGQVNSVAYAPNGAHIASGSNDRTIRIWDARTRQPVGQPLRGHKGPVKCVAFSLNGSRIASGSNDRTIRIWDAHTGQAVGRPFRGHEGWVYSVAYSRDGAYIVSGSEDCTVVVWDAATGQPLRQPLEGHTDWVNSVAYSPDGQYIISASGDHTLQLWDAHTRQPLGHSLQGHTRSANSAACSPNGAYIVSGSHDCTVRIWDIQTGQTVVQPLKGHTDWVYAVAYSLDGTHIASGSVDGTICIWEALVDKEAAEQPLKSLANDIYCVAYSPNGAYIASGSSDSIIHLWGADTKQTTGQLKGHTDWVHSISWAPDGAHIASASEDCTVRIWDIHTELAIGQPLRGHKGPVYSAAYSPNGARIVSGSGDHTICIWDTSTAQVVGKLLEGHTDWVFSVAYSPNGNYIVSGSNDCTVRIWDANTGEPVGRPLAGHTRAVTSVAYSPGGAHIVSGSYDHTIRIWDAHTGQAVMQPLNGHIDWIYSVVYSPSGAHIVSGSRDLTVRIWDAYTGEAVGSSLWGHRGSVTSVVCSPDGAQIASGSRDCTIRFWNFEFGLPIADPSASGECRLHLAVRHPQNTWALNENGWVIDNNQMRLVWVPPDVRDVLLLAQNTAMISADGSVKLEFSGAKLGDEWHQCYFPRESS